MLRVTLLITLGGLAWLDNLATGDERAVVRDLSARFELARNRGDLVAARKLIADGATHYDVAGRDDRSLLYHLAVIARQRAAAGRERLEPVRIIGEMGVLTGLSRSSRVVVEEKADVLAISRALLQGLAENDPDVGARLLINLCKTLYERVFGMNGDIEKLHQRVDALATRLKELAPDAP